MTVPISDEERVPRSATLGALLSIVGEIVFGLTLFPLFLKTAFPHTTDFTPERFFLSVAGWFVTAGWLLQRGKPRGGAFRLPGGAEAIKNVLSEVFYPALAMFAVFCISLVAVLIIATLLCTLIFHQ